MSNENVNTKEVWIAKDERSPVTFMYKKRPRKVRTPTRWEFQDGDYLGASPIDISYESSPLLLIMTLKDG